MGSTTSTQSSTAQRESSAEFPTKVHLYYALARALLRGYSPISNDLPFIDYDAMPSRRPGLPVELVLISQRSSNPALPHHIPSVRTRDAVFTLEDRYKRRCSSIPLRCLVHSSHMYGRCNFTPSREIRGKLPTRTQGVGRGLKWPSFSP